MIPALTLLSTTLVCGGATLPDPGIELVVDHAEPALTYAAETLREKLEALELCLAPSCSAAEPEFRLVLRWAARMPDGSGPIHEAVLTPSWDCHGLVLTAPLTDTEESDPADSALAALADVVADAVTEALITHDRSVARVHMARGEIAAARARLARAASWAPDDADVLEEYAAALAACGEGAEAERVRALARLAREAEQEEEPEPAPATRIDLSF